MAQPFSHLRDKMSPERQERVEARVQQAIQDMALAELRAARDLTQEHLSCNAPHLSSNRGLSAVAHVVFPLKLPGRLVAQG